MISTRRLTLAVAAAMFVPLASLSAQDTPAAGPTGGDDVCIAVVQPLVTGVEGEADPVASSIRALFVSYLTGPSMKAVPLDARLPSQAAEEARQKSCTNVLTITVAEKHSGGRHKLAGLTSAAGTAAGYVPYAGSAAGAVAEGAAVGGTEAVSAVASSTRSKDEMTIEYGVTSTDGKTVLAKRSDKAKASSDGEDLITPLVAKAAEAIAAAVGKQ